MSYRVVAERSNTLFRSWLVRRTIRKPLSCRSMLKHSIYEREGGITRFEQEIYKGERWVRPRRKVRRRHWAPFRDACRGCNTFSYRGNMGLLYSILIHYRHAMKFLLSKQYNGTGWRLFWWLMCASLSATPLFSCTPRVPRSWWWYANLYLARQLSRQCERRFQDEEWGSRLLQLPETSAENSNLTTVKLQVYLVVPSGSLVARVFDHVLPIVNACFCA